MPENGVFVKKSDWAYSRCNLGDSILRRLIQHFDNLVESSAQSHRSAAELCPKDHVISPEQAGTLDESTFDHKVVTANLISHPERNHEVMHTQQNCMDRQQVESDSSEGERPGSHHGSGFAFSGSSCGRYRIQSSGHRRCAAQKRINSWLTALVRQRARSAL